MRSFFSVSIAKHQTNTMKKNISVELEGLLRMRYRFFKPTGAYSRRITAAVSEQCTQMSSFPGLRENMPFEVFESIGDTCEYCGDEEKEMGNEGNSESLR